MALRQALEVAGWLPGARLRAVLDPRAAARLELRAAAGSEAAMLLMATAALGAP